jgi:CHAT domain-containing protein
VQGWTELISAPDEVNAVRASIPEGALIALRDSENSPATAGEGMSVETLLANLPDATILHLACHGHQDSKNALQSGFVMSDKILTIEKLMSEPLPLAFMAFLSACETAKGDKVGFLSMPYI